MPLFVYLPGAASMAVGQLSGCLTPDFCGFPIFAASCPFGGCSVNDAGTILAFNTSKQRTLIYAYGVNGVTDLPITAAAHELSMNDSGQIVYALTSTQTSTFIYSIAHKTVTAIPPLRGSSCTTFAPLSLNNLGQVLGDTEHCTNAADAVYWTWDPVHGTQNLDDQLPPNGYASIQPLGMNDLGQILVALKPPAQNLHWGMLVPTGTATRSGSVVAR
jgi:hypothetical protein